MCGMTNTTGSGESGMDYLTITQPEPRKHPLEIALSAALRREEVLREAIAQALELLEGCEEWAAEKRLRSALSACDEVGK